MEFLQLNKGILLNSDCVSLEQKFTMIKKGNIHESSPSRQGGDRHQTCLHPDSSMLDQLVSSFDTPQRAL